jgi:DNA replication protein DnaC
VRVPAPWYKWHAGSWGPEAAITKLDKYQLLFLDDIAYVTKDQAETSGLFELIATGYERRSLLIWR